MVLAKVSLPQGSISLSLQEKRTVLASPTAGTYRDAFSCAISARRIAHLALQPRPKNKKKLKTGSKPKRWLKYFFYNQYHSHFTKSYLSFILNYLYLQNQITKHQTKTNLRGASSLPVIPNQYLTLSLSPLP
jgi:hypothetical protein